MAVYFQSWSEPWVNESSKMTLANLDERIKMVNIAFANPTGTYTKGSFAGTGLGFSMDFDVVKGAIAILKSRGVVVMLSVGGATYPFSDTPPCNMVNLATDLGCDGIDIDCENGAWGKIVELYKKHTLLKISAAVWSTGAFQATDELKTYIELADWINIMAYDAGNEFVPLDAYQAYKKIFSKKIYVGFCIGQQSWGGHLTNLDEVIKVKAGLMEGDSFFIWAMGKPGSPTVPEILGAGSTSQIPPPQTVPPVPKESNVRCPNCQILLSVIIT